MVRLVTLVLLLGGCAGASGSIRPTQPEGREDGDARVRAFAAELERRARQTSPVIDPCEPLPVDAWAVDPLLQIHAATTCEYRVTWLGWSPPRSYDYVPDAQGFIVDYFIQSAHGWVFWNLRTGDVIVRPVEGQPALDATSAHEVAAWARATSFPGLDPARATLVPTPCTTSPCTPHDP